MTAAERALAFVAALVLPDGRRWGEIAEPWQWEFAFKFLNPNTKKPFSYVTRPRGGSKTFDVSACLLAIMRFQAPAGAHLYAVAADLDQARLIRDTIQDLVRFNPDLADQLTITATTVRLKRNGVTLHILPADAPGSWGLRPHAIVIDELGQWPRTHRMRELLESMLSAVVKVKGCRLAVVTTAADPTHYSYELLAHARASTKWGVYEVSGPLPWRSEEELEEQRSILTESSFRRLHLNEWTEAEDRLTTRDQLLACVTHSQPLPPRPDQLYLIAADLGIRVDPAVAVVAHLERSPSKERPESLETRVVIDCIQRWEPTRQHPVSLDNVGDWILSTGRTYNRATVIFDPWQARHLGEQLTKKSLRVEEYVFTSASKDRLAQTLFLCIKDRVLALPDDAEMIEELLRVRIVESGPGILALDHDRGEHDDQAVAIGLAATRLLERGLPRDPRFRGVHIPPPPRYGLRSIL